MRTRAGGDKHNGWHRGPIASPAAETDHAWRVLALVNDSIRHAENKGAITMGAAGVIGATLYNLVGNRAHPGVILDIAAAICAIFVVIAATFAGLCLMPRLRSKDEPNSLVYFHHIARRHQSLTGSADYVRSLEALINDNHLLIQDLGMQIWANTQVARRKYQMNKLGLLAILLASFALAATSIIAVASTQTL